MRDQPAVHLVAEAGVAAVGLRLEDGEIVGERAAAPAVFLGNRRAQQPQLSCGQPELTVDTFLLLPAIPIRDGFGLEELGRHLFEVGDFVVDPRRGVHVTHLRL